MRTLKRAEGFDAPVKRLVGSPHPVTGQSIFPTFRDLLCFCAALGYENESRKPLKGNLVDFVDGRIFANHEPAVDLLYLISLAEKRDINILRDENEDEAIQIFEEYANGGLEILADWLNSKPEDLHGEKAILSALASKGYLTGPAASPDTATAEVSF
jgi:dnd system-associated protein 4